MTSTEKQVTDEFVEHFEKPESKETYGWICLAFEELGTALVDRCDPRVQELIKEAKQDYWQENE